MKLEKKSGLVNEGICYNAKDLDFILWEGGFQCYL